LKGKILLKVRICAFRDTRNFALPNVLRVDRASFTKCSGQDRLPSVAGKSQKPFVSSALRRLEQSQFFCLEGGCSIQLSYGRFFLGSRQ
jgi:hypothetical protein